MNVINKNKRQQGLVLLILVIIIVLAFATYSLSGLSINQIKLERIKTTQATLKKAKQAVIGHAVARTYLAGNEGEFGYLPCPDYFNGALVEGGSDSPCGNVNTNVAGYLPWKTLESGVLRDDSNSCLWYLLSGDYKQSSSSEAMVNEDSYGMFQVVDEAGAVIEGNNPDERIVAVVIAPGEALPYRGPVEPGQSRNFDSNATCGKDYGNLPMYLEGNSLIKNGELDGGADAIDKLLHATVNSHEFIPPFNDRFVSITRDEIWPPIVNSADFVTKMENLTQALAMCLASYANMTVNTGRRLPWPVVTNLVLRKNYRDNDNYVDDNGASNGYSGRYPFNIASTNNAIWSVTIPAGVVGDLFNIIDPDTMPINPNPPFPPQPQLCGNLILTSGPDAGSVIDLYSAISTYRKLWNNWKDHFFYILSKPYEPDSAAETECGVSDCNTVNGVQYAGAVIFSGRRLLDGAGNDTLRSNKSVVADYLENGNSTSLANEASNKNGNESYLYTDPQTANINDIMYCIQNKSTGLDLDVMECL